MILDMTCGARLMWHQKHHPDAVYCDIRQGTETLSDGREVHINPDQVADFRRLPFPDETFTLVNFDPPHLTKAGNTSWLAKKIRGALHHMGRRPQSWLRRSISRAQTRRRAHP